MGWIKGNATWYNLCNGDNGACGGCDNDAAHVAWPNVTTTGCNYHCGTNAPLQCHNWIYVWNQCTNIHTYAQVKDCCPCRPQQGCDRNPTCGYGGEYRIPIVDLTEGFFIALGGNLDDGRMPIKVYTW